VAAVDLDSGVCADCQGHVRAASANVSRFVASLGVSASSAVNSAPGLGITCNKTGLGCMNRVSGHTGCSTHHQETSVQIRRYVVTAAASGALLTSGIGLALAVPATAAPTATSTASPSPVVVTVPASAVPTSVRTGAPRIDVPAGNAGQSDPAPAGPTSLDIAALAAAGVVLVGGGTVLAIRRRG
jgi:hypothetical protein